MNAVPAEAVQLAAKHSTRARALDRVEPGAEKAARYPRPPHSLEAPNTKTLRGNQCPQGTGWRIHLPKNKRKAHETLIFRSCRCGCHSSGVRRTPRAGRLHPCSPLAADAFQGLGTARPSGYRTRYEKKLVLVTSVALPTQ